MNRMLSSLVIVAISAIFFSACSGNDITSPTSSTTVAEQAQIGSSTYPPSSGNEQEEVKMVNVVWAPRDPCPNNGTWENPVSPAATISVSGYGNTLTLKASVNGNMETAPVRFPVGTTLTWDSVVDGTRDYQPINGSLVVGKEYTRIRFVHDRKCGGNVGGEPPQPPPVVPPNDGTLACTPKVHTVNSGELVHFEAYGNDNTYTWTAPDGIPKAGSGAGFSTTFWEVGVKTVTVTSGLLSAICEVTVVKPPTPTCSMSVSPTTVKVGDLVVATIRVTSGVATNASFGDANFPLIDGVATTPPFVGGSQPAERTLVGTVTGPGGTGQCMTTLTIVAAPPPVCPPSFVFVRQGSWVISEPGGVNVKAIYSVTNYSNVSAVLHWSNGNNSAIKDAKQVSASCDPVTDALNFYGVASGHLPASGAKYTLMLVRGVVSKGPVPQGMEVIAQFPLN
ncbi:MAG: hypothetical protein WAX44_02730 [Minisyncoccia bacterium]